MHPTIANGLIGPSCIDSLGIWAARRRSRNEVQPIARESYAARLGARGFGPIRTLDAAYLSRTKGLRALLLVGVAANDENLLQRRAFELYELRGREEGHDLDDWLQAESEFVQQKTKAAAAQGTVCKFLCWVC